MQGVIVRAQSSECFLIHRASTHLNCEIFASSSPAVTTYPPALQLLHTYSLATNLQTNGHKLLLLIFILEAADEKSHNLQIN